jgi:hypothetical protein
VIDDQAICAFLPSFFRRLEEQFTRRDPVVVDDRVVEGDTADRN